MLRFTDRRFHPALEVTVEDLTLRARMEGERLELTRLTGRMAGGILSVRGIVGGLASDPDAHLQLSAERLPLEALWPGPAPGPGQPRLVGQLSATAELRWTRDRMVGSGVIRIERPRLENLNVIREVFDRLTILPGVTERLLARLPDSYRQKMLERDTRLEPVELRVVAQGDEIAWEQLRIASDTFEVLGSGAANLRTGQLRFPAQIRLEPALSAALIRSVEELELLADEEGRLSLPIVFDGILPRVAVGPDLEQVAQRLFLSKGMALVGRLLEKVFGASEGSE
jgi:hypothetical protein